jgi:hypothetical protein
MVPYRYISVRSINNPVLISGLSFSFNECEWILFYFLYKKSII